MLAIRFNRTGKRNRAHFRVVVQEHTQAPGKRHVEIVGSYDPHKKTTLLKKDRILYWIGQGAQVSDAVHNMLVREGIVEAKKIAKKMPRPVVKEEVKAEEVPTATEATTETPETIPEAPAVETEKTEETPAVAEVAPETPAEPVAEVAPAVEEVKTETVPEEPKA